MKVIILLFTLLVLPAAIFAQEKLENDIDYAYQNAKKGIYWALSNIPEKKAKLEKDLIAEDRLYSTVKLYKEVNGVKVVSKGFYHSNQVEITVYKSYDSLQKDGYLKKESGEE